MTQVTDELALKLSTWVCIDCQIDRFVIHMPLGIIRPVILESGGNLLGIPALGQHAMHDLEQFRATTKNLAAPRDMSEGTGAGTDSAGAIALRLRLTPNLSTQCTGLTSKKMGNGTQ